MIQSRAIKDGVDVLLFHSALGVKKHSVGRVSGRVALTETPGVERSAASTTPGKLFSAKVSVALYPAQKTGV